MVVVWLVSFEATQTKKNALAVAGGGGGPTDGKYGAGATSACMSSTIATSMQGQDSGAIRTGGGGGGYCGGKHGANSGSISSGGANFVGKVQNPVNLAGTSQTAIGKIATPPKTDDPDYISGVGFGYANDCTLGGGHKAGGPALVVLRYLTVKPIDMKDSVGVRITNKKSILTFGSDETAGFFHDDTEPGILHFFGKNMYFDGASLTESVKGRRLDITQPTRVKELEAKVEALQETVRRLEPLQETVRRLEQALASMVKPEEV